MSDYISPDLAAATTRMAQLFATTPSGIYTTAVAAAEGAGLSGASAVTVAAATTAVQLGTAVAGAATAGYAVGQYMVENDILGAQTAVHVVSDAMWNFGESGLIPSGLHVIDWWSDKFSGSPNVEIGVDNTTIQNTIVIGADFFYNGYLEASDFGEDIANIADDLVDMVGLGFGWSVDFGTV